MPEPILSARSRIRADQADIVLTCYAHRRPPKETGDASGLSLNTVYEFYARIRWRLILTGYYQDGARSIEEQGLGPEMKQALLARRGIGEDDFYAHSAEVIAWAEKWPPPEVLRHLRKIISLTGPLDVEPELTAGEITRLKTYIQYAKTKLIHDRVKEKAETDETQLPFLERTQIALNTAWRTYRTATKKTERLSRAKRTTRRS